MCKYQRLCTILTYLQNVSYHIHDYDLSWEGTVVLAKFQTMCFNICKCDFPGVCAQLETFPCVLGSQSGEEFCFLCMWFRRVATISNITTYETSMWKQCDNVKGVTHIDQPAENDYLDQQLPYTELYSELQFFVSVSSPQLYCFGSLSLLSYTFLASACSCFLLKKTIKALCTLPPQHQTADRQLVVNIVECFSAKEPFISLRSWWGPKTEVEESEYGIYIQQVDKNMAPNGW